MTLTKKLQTMLQQCSNMNEKDIHSEISEFGSGHKANETETVGDQQNCETKHEHTALSDLMTKVSMEHHTEEAEGINVLEGADNEVLKSSNELTAGMLKQSDKIDVNESALAEPIAGMTPSAISLSSCVRVKMLARVSLSDAHFKHQQRGEPDLTMDEKVDIAQKLLDESKTKFLARFGNYLELEDLEYFSDSLDVYEVNFHVNQIRKSKGTNFHRNRVKNRRFEAMKDLTEKGDYFSEDEMKYREPYLYQQMVGQYLTDDEIQAKIDKSDLRFSTILLKHIDQLSENARFDMTKDKEEGQEEEEEESDEEDNDNEEAEEMDMENGQSEDEKKPKISAQHKEELRAEFLAIMQQKFLQGEDKTFDYSSVDNNDAYDDLHALDIEEEEKYFDDEDAESIHSDSL